MLEALTTTCLRPSCVTISGGDHELTSSRSTRQSSFPLFLSRTTRCEPFSWSNFRKREVPSSTGATPSPKPSRISIGPNFFCQANLPSRSYTYTPREPKKATTCLPSVTGVFDAKLPYRP